MRVKNKKVLVLGGGKSGISAGKFLLNQGAKVDLYDDSTSVKPIYQELEGAEFFLGEKPDFDEVSYDFAVISPGIPLTNSLAIILKEHGIPILGELELAARFLTAPIIGITGTNGKTTTTTLVGKILTDAGYRTFVGGNIGTPLLDGVGKEYDYFVVEMSSFQIETLSKLNAKISLFLNLTPDHLNRHGDMEGYYGAKANLARCQSKDHFAVVNYDDPYFSNLEKEMEAKCVFFSVKESLYEGTFLDGDTIIYRYGDIDEKIMNRRDIKLPGAHNLENALGAITIGKLLDVDAKSICKTLKGFKGVEHRMEKVATVKGVTYVNDSKATNSDSVLKALTSYGEIPLILIAGGQNKGSDFDVLFETIKNKVKYTILIGECAGEMAASAKKVSYDSFEIAEDMDAAVRLGAKIAQKGDIVLLSPANASFDQFDNYEQRGDIFKKIVKNLK